MGRGLSVSSPPGGTLIAFLGKWWSPRLELGKSRRPPQCSMKVSVHPHVRLRPTPSWAAPPPPASAVSSGLWAPGGEGSLPP